VDAKQYFSALAERRRALGDAHGAADALLRLGSLDPEDLDARLAAARAVAAAGGGERVVGELRGVAEALAERGERDRALAVLEEAGQAAPGDPSVKSALVAGYAAAGQIDRAREFATTPGEFVSLADALDARGDREGALEMIERALSIAPKERGLVERVVRGYAAMGAAGRACAWLDTLGDITEPDLLRLAAELRADAGEHDASRGLFARLLAREPHLAPAIASRATELAATRPDAALVYVESAGDTFLLHGDFAAAAGVYQAFLRHQPQHVAAGLRLVEICVDGQLDTLSAAQAGLVDAYLAAGRGDEARAVAEDLVATHPGDAAHLRRLRRAMELSGEPDVERALADRAAEGAAAPGETFDLSDEDSTTPDLERTQGGLPTGPDATPAQDAGRQPVAARPPASGDPFKLGPIAIDLGDILGDDLETPGGGADRELSEVDLSDALAGLKAPPPAPPATSTPPSTLEGVFAEFRDEIDRHSQSDAAEQHFKVGLTYEEMGMAAEAIKELQIAVRAPRLRFEAASRLARLSLGAGRPLDAIEWFERAAEAPAPTIEAGRTLLYELGDTLESAGETARALAVFLELQGDAADFRDVARRVERLARVQAGG
jgi:tetratricopeptide (TPR) repeat protein